jgi:hypothetical protein
MKRSELRRRLYTTLAELEPMLEKLEKEGKIGRFTIKKRRPNEITTLKGNYFHKSEEINLKAIMRYQGLKK